MVWTVVRFMVWTHNVQVCLPSLLCPTTSRVRTHNVQGQDPQRPGSGPTTSRVRTHNVQG
jgi:hypothetical protein